MPIVPTPDTSPEGEGSVAAALRAAAEQLAATSDTPRLDAELLLAHTLGVERQSLLLDPARFGVPDSFDVLVARRAAHEPIAYILGWQAFWSLRLVVGPGALIPRPDSEALIEAAVAHCKGQAVRRILDLGTGPGSLLLAALTEFPAATGVGVDQSDAALSYARINADALGMADRALFQGGDWGEGLSDRFDLVLCNPPYVAKGEQLMADVARYEPHAALFADDNGLADYRRILPALPHLMTPKGLALLEIGATQRDAVTAIATGAGFRVQCRQDLGARDRVLILTRDG